MKPGGLLSASIAGFRWIALGKVTFQLISWAMTVFVVRLLQPEDYGLAALAGLVTVLLGTLMDAGFGPALVQRGSLSDAVYRSANGVLLGFAFAGVGALWLLAEPIAAFFSEPRLVLILRVASLQLVFSALSVAPGAQLTAQMSFMKLAIIQTVAGLAQALATFGLALADAAFWSLIVGTLVGAFARLAMLHASVDRRFGIAFDFAPLRPYWEQSRFVIWQRLAWLAAEQSDNLIVGRLLGAAPLGLFSIAKNLSTMPLDRIGEMVNQVSLPVFSRVGNDKSRWTSGFEKLMRISSTLTFPLFWGMAAVAPVALPLILGPKWAGAVAPFVLLALPLPLRTNHALATTALFARGRADVSFYTVAIWAIVMIPAVVTGAQWGLVGVAVAWAISFPFVYVTCALLVSRALESPLGMMLGPTVTPALAAVFSSLVAWGIGEAGQGTVPGLTLLALQVPAGIVAYIGAFRLLDKIQFDEMTSLIRLFVNR